MHNVKNVGIMRKSTSKQHASAAYQSWHILYLEQFWAEAKVC